MIKRHYFISVEKPHDDGHGRYSFDSCTFDYTSWLPNSSFVYKAAIKYMENSMKDIKGTRLRIISFNRV